VILIGATGPVDAMKRRPWIDWIHTAKDQGALIRQFIKWDDQPASVGAAVEAIYRANVIARTAPCGPVYVCLDATLQEEKMAEPIVPPEASRFRAAAPPQPDAAVMRAAAERLLRAKAPFLLVGRVSRSERAWRERVTLAELLGARVVTDRKTAAAFPTDHPLHAAPPLQFLSPSEADLLRQADVILSLDWIDLAGTLRQVWADGQTPATVIHASVDQYVHNGWSMDYHGLPPVDIGLLAEPDATVPALIEALRRMGATPRPLAVRSEPPRSPPDGPLSVVHIAEALRAATNGMPVSLVRLGGGWPMERWHLTGPLDFLGHDGGGGIGSGPGMAIGSALALRGSGRLPVAVIGDGDYLMGVNALWTAAHYRIPLLTIVANNRSFFNDEMHQDRVARVRGREPANRWIGQRISDPDPDLAKLAEGQGVVGLGPITTAAELASAVARGVAVVRDGGACVIDVRIEPGTRVAAAQMIGRK
jgi:thiamine pyrophosphate-dependent acetolactate synthase large subunit-like protein